MSELPRIRLTRRESEFVRLRGSGLSIQETADKMGIQKHQAQAIEAVIKRFLHGAIMLARINQR